ncbi:MAG: hypothetical protein R6X02_25780 [Enhygromyxa sp.]
MFVASMAWANAAHAEEPCGAPIDSFNSCEVVEAPHCQDVCAADAMAVACVAANSDQCMAQCADSGSVATPCPGVCEQQCGDLCAAAIVREGPQECVISCGSSCMGDCAAGCEASKDKTSCYAECNQDCNAYCEVSCDVQDPQLDIDSGLDQTQDRRRGRYHDSWRRYYNNCKRRHGRNYRSRCWDYGRWERDRYDRCWRTYGRRDAARRCGPPPRGWRRHFEQSPGLELASDEALSQAQLTDAGVDAIASQCQTECQQSCSGACEIGNTVACELECQDQVTDLCAPQMSSSCSEGCNRGAVLLCDGQYLEVRDVDACVAALEHEGIEVAGPVTALDAGELVNDALQGASCTVEEPSKRGLLGSLFALFGLGLGAGFLRRRRS